MFVLSEHTVTNQLTAADTKKKKLAMRNIVCILVDPISNSRSWANPAVHVSIAGCPA